MELAVNLLARLLENQKISVTFPDLKLDAGELVEGASYRALCQIHSILCDDSLSDPECFQRIEAVVSLLEDMGLSCGGRHEFG